MNWKFWKKKEIKEEIKYEIFPCSSDDCLVRMTCTKACDKIIMDNELLKKAFLKHNACPDCGSKRFYDGPHGGLAQNVKCTGCGHWFNLGLPLFIERIHMIDRRFLDW